MRPELSIFLFQRLLDADTLPPTAIIREYRLVLESIFGELTQHEGRYFDSLYARMQFVFDAQEVPKSISTALNEVRKRLSGIDLDPEELTVLKKELALAIAHFSGLPVPESLVDQIQDIPSFGLAPHPTEQEVVHLKICVQTISALEARNGSIYFNIVGKEEWLGDIQLDLWDGQHIRFSYLHSIVRPYQTLRVLAAKQIDAHRFTNAAATLVVLEPDILLDISDLAECFDTKTDTPLLFIVKKLMPQQTSTAMFSGTMVNAMFDAAVRSPEPDLVQTYRAAAGEQAFQSAVVGKQELVNIYTEIKTNHWKNLITQANHLRARQVRIEPSFMSDTFGLQGRLDCLVEKDSDPNVKDILELKGGTPPVEGSRISHKMQVTGYNLLLRSAFGPERKGSSVIFYSKAQEDPLRNVLNDHLNEHRLLTLRNQVIDLILRLATQDTSVLDAICEDAAKGLISFQAKHFIQFQQIWNNTSEPLKSYYVHYLGFLCREYLCARTGAYSSVDREDTNDGFAALWRRSEAEKKLTFSILTNLEILSIDEAGTRITFTREPAEHSFREGDLIILYPKSGEALEPMKHQFVKARIESLEREKLIINLNHGQISQHYFASFSKWVIEPDLYDKSYWANAADMYLLLTADKRKQALLMGSIEPIKTIAPTTADTTERIIEQAEQAKDYFLIQGPPGTGKTSKVLTEMVGRLVAKKESAVVVAFTNRAVDEIALQLEKKGVPFLKLGSKGSGAEKQLKAFCNEGNIDLARKQVQDHQIFLATVASMSGKIDQLMRLKEDLHTLIVDEASQLTEPQINGMICRFKKFILIGDQNQLPPVVTQDRSFTNVDDPALLEMGLNNLGASLFERLINNARKKGWHHAYGMLEKHYRMHEEIARLVNPWYGHKLITGLERQRASLTGISTGSTDAWDAIFSFSRKLFIPSNYDPSFKMNRDEADNVYSILSWLKQTMGKGFNPKEDVGVITPWRTQIALIREKLSEDDVLRQVQVDTIERYQGSEKKIIIVSFAVSHARELAMIESPTEFKYEEGEEIKAIAVERKLLVTISRAKERIILLGYKPALLKQAQYQSLLSRFYEVQLPKVQLNIT